MSMMVSCVVESILMGRSMFGEAVATSCLVHDLVVVFVSEWYGDSGWDSVMVGLAVAIEMRDWPWLDSVPYVAPRTSERFCL